MGFRLPQALAGSDNEVELNEDGARRVLELIAGTTMAAAIVAAAGYAWSRLADVAGAESNVGDLY